MTPGFTTNNILRPVIDSVGLGLFIQNSLKSLPYLAAMQENYTESYWKGAFNARIYFAEICVISWCAATWNLYEAIGRLVFGIIMMLACRNTETIKDALRTLVKMVANVMFALVGLIGMIHPYYGGLAGLFGLYGLCSFVVRRELNAVARIIVSKIDAFLNMQQIELPRRMSQRIPPLAGMAANPWIGRARNLTQLPAYTAMQNNPSFAAIKAFGQAAMMNLHLPR